MPILLLCVIPLFLFISMWSNVHDKTDLHKLIFLISLVLELLCIVFIPLLFKGDRCNYFLPNPPFLSCIDAYLTYGFLVILVIPMLLSIINVISLFVIKSKPKL